MTAGPDLAVIVDDGLTQAEGDVINYDQTGPYDASLISGASALNITSANNGSAGNYTVYEDMSITNPSGNCVNVNGAQYIILRNMQIDDCLNGIVLTNTNNIIIEHVEISNAGDVNISSGFGGGILGTNADQVVVRRTHVADTRSLQSTNSNFFRLNAIYFSGGSDQVVVEHSTYRNRVGAHFVQYSGNGVMSNSSIVGNAGQLISGNSQAHDIINAYSSGGSNGDRLDITDNLLLDNGPSTVSTGVIVGDANINGTAYDYTNVSDNILLNTGLVAVNIYDGSHHIVDNNIMRSEAFAWSDRAMSLRQYTNGGTCDSNTISNNRMNFISGGLYGNNGQHYGVYNLPSKPCTNTTNTGNVGHIDNAPDTSIADDLYLGNHSFDVTFTNNGNAPIGGFDITNTPAADDNYRFNYMYFNRADNPSYQDGRLTSTEDDLTNSWTGGCIQPGDSVFMTVVGHVFEDSGAVLRNDTSITGIRDCSGASLTDLDTSNDACYDTTQVGGSNVAGAAAQDCTLATNNTPTQINLSNSSINENNSPNATIGTLTTTDPDTSDTHTYSLATGTGDTDNASFTLSGTNNNTLNITPATDHETKSSYSVRIQTDDGNGGQYQQAFTVTINDVNETTNSLYYVSPNGSGVSTNSSSPGGVADTITAMCSGGSSPDAGDEIVFIDGTYNTSSSAINTDGRSIEINNKNCGTASDPIVLRAQNDQLALIDIDITAPPYSNDGGAFLVSDSSHIAIRNFSIDGNQAASLRWGNGIIVDDSHHVEFAGNHVVDVVGGGVSTLQSTHVKIMNNDFERNGWLHPLCSSNISMFESHNPNDYPNDSDGYANYIVGNRIYSSDNTNFSGCYNSQPSDGNCIILDVNNEIEHYQERTLVANNVCADNGGRGLQSLSSSHIDFVNNTVYQNAQTTQPVNGELMVTCDNRDSGVGAQDINYIGNVVWKNSAYASVYTAQFNSGNDCPLGVDFQNNVFINDNTSSSVFVGGVTMATTTNAADLDNCGSDNLVSVSPAQAGFTNPTDMLSTANFDISASSILIDRGCPALGGIVLDIDGQARQAGLGTDVGAHEYQPSVSDTTPPAISLNGADPQQIIQGNSYIEQGATATDDTDGNITGSIVIDASAVNTSVIGSYSVTYNVQDAAGNNASQQTRTVDVIAPASDTTPPQITLQGANPQQITQGTSYTELGATASDDTDGNITTSIIIDDSAVDTNTQGSYNVTYNVTDTAGNSAPQQTRTVNVVAAPDTTPPQITVQGNNPFTLTQGNAYTDPGATATDSIDGDITSSITNNISAVNPNINVPGQYTITYNVQDTAGNSANQRARIVNVVAPTPSNQAPTDITISTNTIQEPTTTTTPFTIGTFTTTDPDGSDTHTYSIVPGTGDEDNSLFTLLNLNQDTLALTISPDYEAPQDTNTDNIYNVRIMTDDNNGGQYEEALQITITNNVADDPDTDGVDTATEDASPNTGDYNNDGTADSTQNNVATLPNTKATSTAPTPTAGNPSRYVALSSPAGTTLDNVVINTEAELPTQDTTRDYPLGIFSFNIDNVTPGSTQTVTITLDQEYPTSTTDTWTWVKYNNTTNQYTPVPASANLTYNTTTVGSDTVTIVTYDLTDGGVLDEDNTANGTIVDPIGPSVLADTTDTDTIADSGAGDTDSLEDTGVGVVGIVLVGLSLSAVSFYAVSMSGVKRYRV